MKLTTKQLAEILKVNVGTAGKYLNQSYSLRKKYVTKDKRTIYFDDAGLDELKAKIVKWRSRGRRKVNNVLFN